MKRFALTLMMFAVIGNAHGACEHDAARRNLQKWGLAYCITTHVEGVNGQGSAAMGGYFQLGEHNSEEAYQHVRTFFDQWVASHPAGSPLPGTDLSLMACINAYQSIDYQTLIRAQDKYLPEMTNNR